MKAEGATMTKAKEPTQEEPTQPRPTDEAGRELDAFGLPESGPARAAELERRKKPDPRDNPEAWGAKPAAEPPAE